MNRLALRMFAGLGFGLILTAPSLAQKASSILPGGNAKAFDWTILSGRTVPLPWFLAGGLTPQNVAEAVRVTGARAVDVSSGVEAERGVKSIERIRAFLDQVKAL